MTLHPVGWIVGGGLLLRLWNINWSLPELYEEAYPFSVAWKFWNWGAAGLDFNPHFFNYPALTFYLNFLVQGLQYLAGSVTGAYPTPDAFNQAYASDPSAFIVAGRLLSVLFDSGTIYCTFRLGREAAGNAAGVIGAVLVAVNPLHVRQGHLINVDTPLTFFTVLGLYLLYRLVNEPTPGSSLRFGVAAGLAMASKYTGAMLLAVFAIVVIALWTGRGKDGPGPGIRQVLTVLLAAGAVFLAANPYILLNVNEFLADVGFERYHAGYGHLGIDASESAIGFYILNVLPGAIGIPLVIALAAGAVAVAVRRESRMFILLLFAAAYVAGIGLWEMRADRYFLPVVPVFILVGAYGITAIAELARTRFVGRVPLTAVLVALAAAAAFPPASSTWAYQRSHARPDTRTLAKQLIEKNLPGGSAILLSPMGISLPRHYHVLGLPFNPVETERLTPFYDARWYDGFDIAVLSDYDLARYEREPERFGGILRFYRGLRDGGRVAAEVAPEEDQNGPRIWMVSLRRQADAPTYPPDLFANLSRVGHDGTVLDFLFTLSEVLYAKDLLPKGRQALQAGLTISPGDGRFLKNLAWTCFRMGDHPAALDAVEGALKAEPDRPEMVSLKGSILLNLGRYGEAERFLVAALSLNGRLLSAYVDLSEVYERQGRSDLAVATLGKVRSLVAPGSPEARFIEERISALGGPGNK